MPLTGAGAARLFDDHVDAVHALIARRVGPAAAPEVTREAFELALRTWDQFDSEHQTERLFVFGAATKALRSHWEVERSYLASLRVPTPGAPSDVYDPLVSMPPGVRGPRVVDHESNRDLQPLQPESRRAVEPDGPDARIMRAVAVLDPEDRDIVLLSLWESCSQQQIAEVLGLDVGAVRSALGRIRRDLKLAASGAKRRGQPR